MSLRETYGKDVLLTGWGHTRFGKLEDETLESLRASSTTTQDVTGGINGA